MIPTGFDSHSRIISNAISVLAATIVLFAFHGCGKKTDSLAQQMSAERYRMVVQFDSLKASFASMVVVEERLRREHDAVVGSSKDNEDHKKLEIRHSELMEACRMLLEDDAGLIALHGRVETAYLKGEMPENEVLLELKSLHDDELKMIRERHGIEAYQADIISDHEEMKREHTARKKDQLTF